jgi:putative peptide zinc metalloprotease protein
VLVDAADPLAPGEWLSQGEFLGRIVTPDQAKVEVFVSEADLSRTKPGAPADQPVAVPGADAP